MDEAARLYLDLLKKTLTYYIYGESYDPVGLTDDGRLSPAMLARRVARKLVLGALEGTDYTVVRRSAFDPKVREEGRDWPSKAHTMIGLKRLDNIQACIEDVLDRGVPGDLIETGVWRGGAVIFMRAVLKARGVKDRLVWAADSFEGLPPPDPRFPSESEAKFHRFGYLAVSLEQVKANFQTYGLLDDQVRFLKGFFADSLPKAPLGPLALIRFDGDLYSSAMDVLNNLYDKLSPGGYMIVDDYHCISCCREAVDDFRRSRGITDKMETVDWSGAYWRKGA